LPATVITIRPDLEDESQSVLHLVKELTAKYAMIFGFNEK